MAMYRYGYVQSIRIPVVVARTDFKVCAASYNFIIINTMRKGQPHLRPTPSDFYGYTTTDLAYTQGNVTVFCP